MFSPSSNVSSAPSTRLQIRQWDYHVLQTERKLQSHRKVAASLPIAGAEQLWSCFCLIPLDCLTLINSYVSKDFDPPHRMWITPISFNWFRNSHCQNTCESKLRLFLDWIKSRRQTCKSQFFISYEYFAWTLMKQRLISSEKKDPTRRRKTEETIGMCPKITKRVKLQTLLNQPKQRNKNRKMKRLLYFDWNHNKIAYANKTIAYANKTIAKAKFTIDLKIEQKQNIISSPVKDFDRRTGERDFSL